MDLKFLEKRINFKIEGLDKKYGLSSAERSELIKEIWIKALSEISYIDSSKILWGGYTEDDHKVRFQYVSDISEATRLHEKYGTDANIYIGNIMHVRENNTFISTDETYFFIDSWYGYISGKFSSLEVLENGFFARRVA